jgi:hypothetical protein
MWLGFPSVCWRGLQTKLNKLDTDGFPAVIRWANRGEETPSSDRQAREKRILAAEFIIR